MKKILAILIAVVCVAAMCIPTFAAQHEEVAEIVAVVALKPADDAAENCVYKYYFKVEGDPQAWIDAGKNAYEMWWGVGAKNAEDPSDCSACHADWPALSWAAEDGFAVMTVDKFNPAEMNAGEEYAAAKAGNLIGYACELTDMGPEKDGFIIDKNDRHKVGLKSNIDITKTQYSQGTYDGIVLPVTAEEDYNKVEAVELAKVIVEAPDDTGYSVVKFVFSGIVEAPRFEAGWGIGTKNEDGTYTTVDSGDWGGCSWDDSTGVTIFVTNFDAKWDANNPDVDLFEEAKKGNVYGFIMEHPQGQEEDGFINASDSPTPVKATGKYAMSWNQNKESYGVCVKAVAAGAEEPQQPVATGDSLIAVVALVVAASAGVVLTKKH